MTQSQAPRTRTIHTLSFNKLSPRDFERLCLWLARREGYEQAEHLGASGGDKGRDLTAWREGRLWAFQCKRVRSFGPQDALAEVEKILALPEAERPVGLIFLVICDVSAEARRQARARCAEERMECIFWAETELDERVKRHPDIVKEFFGVSISSTVPDIIPPPPRPPRPFIGQRETLDELKAKLATDGAQVALWGIDGLGKTAAAQQLAWEMEDNFPGGIFWTDLPETGGNPLPVLDKWAGWCGRNVSGLSDPQDRAWAVRGALKNRVNEHGKILVVLDNVRSKWLKGARNLQDACPAGVPLLITTCNKELALDLDAEVKRMEALQVEQAGDWLVTLAGSEIELDLDTAKHLAERVGRLPLALKLIGKFAAQYAGKYRSDLASLCDKIEGYLSREENKIKAAFSLSYEELDADQQRLFRALGAFAAAPLAVEHVAAVLGPRWEVETTEERLDELEALSLVQWDLERGLRYTIHPLLRDYAVDLLGKAGEEEAVTHSAHAAHYLGYAEECCQNGPAGYAALGSEHQNLIAALDYLGERAEDEQSAEQYLDMFDYLTGYLRSKGFWQEYRHHAERAYTTAWDLEEWRHAGWLACEVADTYSLEGWRGADLETAEGWVKRGEECLAHITDVSEKEIPCADTLRSRGIIAMRRCQYKDSHCHFKGALQLFEKLALKDKDIYQDVEDIHIYLAKLEMRYNPGVNGEKHFETAEKHFRNALTAAEKYEQEDKRKQQQAIIKTNVAELMIWWSRWDLADEALEEAIPQSREADRNDLLAAALAWSAFVGQYKSEKEDDEVKEIELLSKAIEEARESLEILENSPTSAWSLDLCKAHLLLAGLYRCRQKVGGDEEDGNECSDHLSKARALLDGMPKTARSVAVGKYRLDRDACYEAACYEALLEDFDTSGIDLVEDLLYTSIRVQPGWYNRAKTDFRLERVWEIVSEAVRPRDIIGGDEQPQQPENQA